MPYVTVPWTKHRDRRHTVESPELSFSPSGGNTRAGRGPDAGDERCNRTDPPAHSELGTQGRLYSMKRGKPVFLCKGQIMLDTAYSAT